MNLTYFPKQGCCCSVAKSCPTLYNPMNCSTLGFPVLHHLPELAQIHVHQVSDAIQPSHPLSPPSPPALHLSQYQGLSRSFNKHLQPDAPSSLADPVPGRQDAARPLWLPLTCPFSCLPHRGRAPMPPRPWPFPRSR